MCACVCVATSRNHVCTHRFPRHAAFAESLRRAADGHRDVSVDEIVYRNSAEVVSGRLAAASPGSDFYVAYHVGASPPEALAYELSRDGDGSYSYDDDNEGSGGGDGDGGAAVGGGSPEPSAPPASDRSSRFLIGRVGGSVAGGGYSPSSDPFLQVRGVRASVCVICVCVCVWM